MKEERVMTVGRVVLRATAGAFAVIFLLVTLPLQTANAQTETIIYNFTNTSERPSGPLLIDSAGNLYGTSVGGGPLPGGYGTVFELVNSSGTYTQGILHDFGATGDGLGPSGLLMDSSGNLYGTTGSGGASGAGIAYELVNSGGNYSEKILYSFGATTSDGVNPSSSLIMDLAGNLYGTTLAGGASGFGTVFELVNSSGNYTEKILYSFVGSPSDGEYPIALLMDSTGNLYGAADGGGTAGDGAVFELINSGGSYSEKILYSFTGPPNDGRNPTGLLMDSAGNLYGTTQLGGTSTNCPENCGSVFELVNNSGNYAEKLLHSFTGNADGSYPNASLIIDATGKLYGTTSGDPSISLGNGTLFELTNSSGAYAEYALHVFAGPPGDGTTPGTPVIDSAGSLYGTTSLGGASDYGVAYKFTNASAVTIAFTPRSLDFGGALLSLPGTTQSVTVNNIGAANLSFASGAVTRSGGNVADFAIKSDGCSGHTLAPATGSCTVSVTFTPSILGTETASLNFADNAFGNPQAVPLSGIGQDFSVSSSNTSQTVTAGTSAGYGLNWTPLGGFTGTITLTCAGAPANSTCLLSPASLTLNGDIVYPSSVTVETTGSSAEISPAPGPSAPPPVALWIILAGLSGSYLLMRCRVKGVRSRLLAPLALLLTLTLAGSCGAVGSGHPGYHGKPTPPGTYSLTISGTSGGVTHKLTLTLIVQ